MGHEAMNKFFRDLQELRLRPIPDLSEATLRRKTYREHPIDNRDPLYTEPVVALREAGLAGSNYYHRQDNPPYYAVQTYDGMLMILEALRRMPRVAGTIAADRTALRDGLVSIGDARPMKGARGMLSFAPLEKGRTVAVKPVIVQYQPDNRTTVIWPLDQAGVFVDPRS